MFLAPFRPLRRSTILRLSLLPGTQFSRPLSKQATAVGDSVWFECFDRPSHYGSSRFQDTTGLFGDRRLAHPRDFQSVANDALLKAQSLVERIVNAPSSRAELSQLVDNLDKLSDVLCSVIDLAELVRSTHPDADWVDHANTVYESLCEYMNVLNTHPGLDSALQVALNDKDIVKSLSSEAKETARIFANDFTRSGIRLPPPQRAGFVRLSSEILSLGRTFLSNVSTDRPPVRLSAGEIRNSGSGARFLNQSAEVPGNSAMAHAILGSAPDENVRRKVYTASKQSSREQLVVLEFLLKARADLAHLVGYSSFAAMTLDDKMAKTPDDVSHFLRSLATHIRPDALDAAASIQRSKQQHLRLPSLPIAQSWDREYYLSSEPPRPAHQLPSLSVGTVFRALSRLFNRLYGITLSPIEPQPGEIWHKDVQKLEVVSEEIGTLGYIYTDLFARHGKGVGAAHYTVQCSRRLSAEEAANESISRVGYNVKLDGQNWQLPIVVLACDFSRPNIEWYEVQTLFHEMGHAMHSMIGRTEYHNVSGTRCATDFVELPSILMEHFLTSPQVLQLFHDDVKTVSAPQASIAPQANRGAALDALHQIILALLDQAYHSAVAQEKGFDSTVALAELLNTFDVFPYAPGTSWQTQFGHLFTYGATYYSYLFDRAIASQVWNQIFSADPLNRERGELYKNEVLRWGGSKDPWLMLSRLLSAPHLAEGGPEAMKEVGRWGVAEAGVAGQGIH